MTVESPEPLHEGFIVIRAEVVPVFHDEKAFKGGADLVDRREIGIGEDVAFDPWINTYGRYIPANRME